MHIQDCEIIEGSQTFPFEKIKNYSSCVLITDERVFSLYGKEIPVEPIIVPSGEKCKSFETAEYCWSKMYSIGLDRRSCVISLGGGSVTDLAGFVASCYMRGIDVIHIPTTLLAMVDAAIGGKTAVNLTDGKNIIGTFHHPKCVIINPHYLHTLSERDYRSGLAEVIKYGVIWDEQLFEYLENNMADILDRKMDNIIRRCCEIKTEVVRRDDKEKGLRSILNWGHTFAHALETATDFSTYLHGEAVSIGMSCAAHVSQLKGYVDREFIKRQDTLCERAGLPIELPLIPIDSLVELMRKDKKAESGNIVLVLAEKIGKVIKVDNVDESVIREALEWKNVKR